MKIKLSKIPGWCISSKFFKLNLFNFTPFFSLVTLGRRIVLKNDLNSLSLNLVIFHHLIIRKKFESLNLSPVRWL